ncbi:MAG: SpoIID/LytB domain-containing protein, partial [Firmicutes bacterium]|nr:SpoIID/LytB domain-containing protein [Bacillota bacterium]
MKRAALWVLIVELVVMLLVPALIVRGLDLTPRARPPGEIRLSGPLNVRVLVHSREQVEDIPLERYVVGVVAAEMPAEFAPEALKAQAVAARTYVAKRMRSFGGAGSPEHPEADICTDAAHGQAWMTEDEMRRTWGPLNFGRYLSKIEQAVESTAGLIMTFDGLPVDPVYHSTSGGPTEDAQDVWGNPVPYLRSVPCDFCRHSPYYSHVIEMPLAEMGTRLGDRDVPVFLQSGKGRVEV